MKTVFTFITSMLTLLIMTGKSQEGLVSYYSFDELVGGQFIDSSQHANHGTVYGAQLIPGVKNNALSFDGIDDYARIPKNGQNPPSILSELGQGSISVWFRVDHIPTDFGIAPVFYYGAEEMCDFWDAANQGLIIELGHTPVHYGSKNLYFTIWKNGCTVPSFCFDSFYPLSEGVWYHFVAVVGEDYNTGYLNGGEMYQRRYNFGDETYSQFFADAVVHEKLWLGKGYWDHTVQHYDGAIDELRIYNRDLSASEVQQLYSDTTITSLRTDREEIPEIRIFPNPASSMLYYDITGSENVVRSIKVSDITGQVVLDTGRNGENFLDISHLPDGYYNIAIIVEENTYRERFMISH